MSWRHANNWSHPGHYLVDPYTWPWSPNGHGHKWPTATPFVQCLPFWDTAISKFAHENPWSRSCVCSKVKVTFDLQNSKVKVMVKVKPISHIWGLNFNRYVFAFRFLAIRPFLVANSSCVWSNVKVTFDLQNSKVKVMVKVKTISHLRGLEFNRSVCFSFRGNRTIFGWDIANSIFNLENSRSRS